MARIRIITNTFDITIKAENKRHAKDWYKSCEEILSGNSAHKEITFCDPGLILILSQENLISAEWSIK